MPPTRPSRALCRLAVSGGLPDLGDGVVAVPLPVLAETVALLDADPRDPPVFPATFFLPFVPPPPLA